MTNLTTFLVNRNRLSDTELQSGPTITRKDLKPGQVLLKVDRFAFTANNITYAVLGDALRYWEFFPSVSGQGIIPVWGFADVEASLCDGIVVGERLYGYYPMSTHLVVEPRQVSSSKFEDGAEHRQPLSNIYNQYTRCANDPIYSANSEALQMLLRPLFMTSFLLDDFFEDSQFFAANTVVLTSASSKTALGMAFLLHQSRSKRGCDYKIVGLTSPRNLDFVKGLGCYDRVLSYAQITELDASEPTAAVDFAGNGGFLGQLHSHLNEQLRYSCLVGAAHWDQRRGLPEDLAGPAPQIFFAPSHARNRVAEWGGVNFQRRLADAWFKFTEFVGGWMNVEADLGPSAVGRVYRDVLAGHLDPATGYILSLWEE